VADGTPMLPRWPFAPTAITLPDRTENSVGDHQNDAAWIDDGLTAQALANAQGGPTVLHPITVADFAEMARPWSDFPRDWLSVQIAAALLVRKARSVETDPPEWLFPGLASAERSEEVARIRTEAQAWFDHALRNGAFERLDEAVREAFWQWFTSHAALTRLIAPDVCIAAVETGLHAYPETARELPHGLIDRLAHRHTLAVHLPEGIHAIVPDRMLAPFSDVQGEHHARSDTHLLLFELSSNDGLGHHFGEGVFQFWITPQDLAARAFDKVEMTTTAY